MAASRPSLVALVALVALAARSIAACGSPSPAVSATAAASACPPPPAPAPAPAPPPDPDAWFLKAASAAEACPWTDATGFARDCPALEALEKELDARQPAASHVARLLADPEPRRRSIGILLHRSLDEQSQAEMHAAILYAALAETVPALDGRLAMFAAHLPASGALDHAKVDHMARSTRPRARSIFLSFLSFDRKEEPWIMPLYALAISDVDAAVRLGAVRGAMGLSAPCPLWRKALGDGDDAVRHAAQRSLVGSVDFVIEDETGLFGGRGAWRQSPCAPDEIDAALKSVQRDLQARRISDADQAIFFSGLLRALPKEKSKVPLDALRAIATDTKRPSAARTLAIRALRTREEGKKIVATLANDPDPAVAKAATDP